MTAFEAFLCGFAASRQQFNAEYLDVESAPAAVFEGGDFSFESVDDVLRNRELSGHLEKLFKEIER